MLWCQRTLADKIELWKHLAYNPVSPLSSSPYTNIKHLKRKLPAVCPCQNSAFQPILIIICQVVKENKLSGKHSMHENRTHICKICTPFSLVSGHNKRTAQTGLQFVLLCLKGRGMGRHILNALHNQGHGRHSIWIVYILKFSEVSIIFYCLLVPCNLLN